MLAAGQWRYGAVAVLGLAAVVFSTSGVGRLDGPAAVAEPVRFASCGPSLVVDSPFQGLFDLDPESGVATPRGPWNNRRPLDLSKADYAPDGTLYMVTKTSPSDRAARWEVVDLERQSVTLVGFLPPELTVIDVALTPMLDAAPVGYLLTGIAGGGGEVQLQAIDFAWPLALTPVPAVFPRSHNFSLGLGISEDGSSVYYTTVDGLYVGTGPSPEFLPRFSFGSLGFSRFTQVAGPAAGDAVSRISMMEGPLLRRLNLIGGQVSSTSVQGVSSVRGLVYRECPPGGIRFVPQAGLTTTELGGTAQFTAVLTAAPTSDVTVTFETSDASEGSVGDRQLTFTPADWFTPQTVTVSGVADGIVDGKQAYRVLASSVMSGDPDYDGRAVGSVAVQNLDADTPAQVKSPRPRPR